MSYYLQEIGVTGPAGRIGSGTEYHIDTKFSNTLSFEQIRDRFDALARKYAEQGRKIEFSNPDVASLVYDVNATPEERLSLLRRAAAAHSHSKHSKFHSFDYYAPLSGKDRWDKSAEGAPIYVVGAKGLKIQGGSGGGYGNYGLVLDEAGNVVSKSGHGDNSRHFYAGGTLGGQTYGSAYLSDDEGTRATPEVVRAREEAVERAKTYADMSKSEMNAEYDRLRAESPETAAEEGLKMHKAFFKDTLYK